MNWKAYYKQIKLVYKKLKKLYYRFCKANIFALQITNNFIYIRKVSEFNYNNIIVFVNIFINIFYSFNKTANFNINIYIVFAK